MSISLIGLSHHTAPIEIREQLYISPKKTGEMLRRLKAMPGINETVILSTCNRTEIYAVCEGEQYLIDCINSLRDKETPDLQPYLYIKRGTDAVSHLFSVTAGLESLAIGEDQIQGQVAAALDFAQQNKTIGKNLNILFQNALRVGKRLRTETSISNGETALSKIAFKLVTETFPGNPALSVLLIGAGDIAEATAKHLSERHAHIVFVANRTHAHAIELAERFGGEAVSFHDIEKLLAECDVVISSTAAPHPVITAASVEKAMQLRNNRSLHLVDLALPRDIEPQASGLPGVFLHNLDDLQTTAQIYREQQTQEIQRAEDMLADEITQWCTRQTKTEMAAVIAALHTHFEEVRDQEINAIQKQLEKFTPQQREIVETLTQSIIKKLLHTPTINCKEHYAQCGDDTAAEILRELFGLSSTEKDDK
ncbi:MAG: glutamyl-tRNA reductase [bacterium]